MNYQTAKALIVSLLEKEGQEADVGVKWSWTTVGIYAEAGEFLVDGVAVVTVAMVRPSTARRASAKEDSNWGVVECRIGSHGTDHYFHISPTQYYGI